MPGETVLSQSISPMQAPEAPQETAITQELVEKLADKVLALLLEDLKNESERYRLPSKKLAGLQGGR
jgi:hypothetical protein